jgi:hypothetical protein
MITMRMKGSTGRFNRRAGPQPLAREYMARMEGINGRMSGTGAVLRPVACTPELRLVHARERAAHLRKVAAERRLVHARERAAHLRKVAAERRLVHAREHAAHLRKVAAETQRAEQEKTRKHEKTEAGGRRHAVAPPAGRASLRWIRCIRVPRHSVFYSFTPDLRGFGRSHYAEHSTISVRLNSEMTEVRPGETVSPIKCEDPRCFEHQGKLYVVDNRFLGDERNRLYCVEDNTYRSLDLEGKNLSYISHRDTLYVIHRFCPFHLYSLDVAMGRSCPVFIDTDGEEDWEYRGGTPGYPDARAGVYHGFGHRTHLKGETTMHDIFVWTLHLEGKIRIEMEQVPSPPEARNISDPTCVLHGKYLVTAESDQPWFTDQVYVTNLYEIKWGDG